LVLYPIVFLWGFFFSDPIFAKHGTPAWLWLFMANLFSTQIMGWYVVPWAFKRYSFWLRDNPGMNSEIIGWVSVLVFYAISMAVYAYILTQKPLDYF
jgi:antibiotic biosynthesis monooxygenase (ABM) superfamily enzyme